MNISTPMAFHPLTPDTLHDEASKVVDFVTKYYKNVEKYPVRSQVKPGYLKELIPKTAPASPESLDQILEDVESKILPGLTHWQSPNFFAYFQATVSNAGLLGEILISGLNVVGFNWISSPAATELEVIVVDWLGKMLQLPESFLFSGGGGGVIQGSSSESITCTMAAARDRALKNFGEEKIIKLVVYASDQTHFAFQKAAKLLGILPRNFRVLPTTSSTDYALSHDVLRAAIEADIALGLLPMYICATRGATGSGAVDPVHDLGQVAKSFGVWLHVDGAYGGSACVCPEYTEPSEALELADSLSMSTHKWFLTNMDCSCLWIKNPKLILDSLSQKPEILSNKATDHGEVIDFKDWQLALSRRFRALKLWMVIRQYGSTNLMNHIRSDIDLARHLESLIENDKRFELAVPRKFALVCFRLKPLDGDDNGNEINKNLLEGVNSSGQAYMTHTVLGGIYAIRCAIGGSLTEMIHIDKLWKLIQAKGSK